MNKTGHITYAYLETTNYCNLDCSFCNRMDVIGPLKHMSLDNWQKLLDGISHHPITETKLMGMGEPMLHPQFDEVCRMFKETFPDAKVIVATNCQYKITEGSKFRKKFQESLKYIDMLYLSIDGWGEHYERDRSPAKWDVLMKFLEDFRTIERHGCEVPINYVVNAYNVDDIPKVEAFVDEYKLDGIRLNIAQIWDENTSMKDDIATSGYSEEQLKYLMDNYQDKIMGKAVWDFDDCFWVDKGLYVTVEGNVKVCCMNTGATPLGNLFEEHIDEIHRSPGYQAIKNGCKTKNPTEHCLNCSYKELTPILSHLGVNN
jgi:MoaA/NifB/PqqE/SkfB family radical SAM enzyme